MTRSNRPGFGALIFYSASFALSIYFTFAAVQGDFGLFRRVEIDAEIRDVTHDLELLNAEVARMENLTLRLSDTYLDVDLLDEQARTVLGLLRADELVIR
ncbi:MAG: septum formation initiator family protein [Aestuariivita sp.]|uniref:FtsB family cell division protein n=1 Tax=Aestuariivita sp. TaxID=1872407 RepID=UPI003BB11D58